MLKWLRRRNQADEFYRIALRPFLLLQSRREKLLPNLWQTRYCCTISYYWSAVVVEELSGERSHDGKHRALREAFARLVQDTRGEPHNAMKRVLPEGHPIRRRALSDLKRVVDLYNGKISDRYMIYPEYREAIYEDGRPAPGGDRWGLDQEYAYEILLSSYLAANALTNEEEEEALS